MTSRTRVLVDDLPLPPKEPDHLEPYTDEPDEPSDLGYEELPCTDDDDAKWEVFIPDDDEFHPEPTVGNYWIEDRGSSFRREVVQCCR